MGGKEGGSSETGTGRRQEGRCQKGGGEDGTSKGGEEGCGQGRRTEGGTKEVRPGKGGESSGQEGCEEVGFGHNRRGGSSTDVGSRGAVASFTASNVARQHEKLTGKHRPVVEDRAVSRRCLPSSHGPRSSLSDGRDVGTHRRSVEGATSRYA